MDASAEQLAAGISESLEMLQEVGGREFVSQIVSMFLEETPQLFAAVREGLASGDGETAASAAHKLVGSARQFGMSDPIVPFEELELTARAGGIERAKALLAASEAAYAQSLPLFRRHVLPG